MKVSGLTIRKPDSVWTFLKKKKVTQNGYNFDDSWKTKEDLSKRRVIPQWALDKKKQDECKSDKVINDKNYVWQLRLHCVSSIQRYIETMNGGIMQF